MATAQSSVASRDVPVTAEIAKRATQLAWQDLPDDLIERTKQCLLDWFAVTVAGAQDDLTDILVQEAIEDGATGSATLVARSEKTLPSVAALINGAASHALDYDDVNFAMGGHPTVTVVPALLALGEQIKASGRLFIESFVAGYETSGRVGRLVAPSHYQKGFHVTGTVGTFSATAAAGRMLGLDDRQLATAFGIAATQASGLKSNFGTMCKPLHAGTASEQGLRAARLAAKGFTARPDSLECDQGFAASQSDHFAADAALGEPPSGWHLRNNLFKYHAACYLTHAPIECAKEIRLKSNFPPERVQKILLRIDSGADRVCNIPHPTSGLEAKFSLRQTVAMALTGVDTANLNSYTAAITEEPRIKKLRDKMAIEFQPNWAHSLAEMAIQLDDGSTLEASHDSGIPWPDLARQRQALEAKFDSLVTPVLGSAAAKRLRDTIDRVDRLADIGELVRASAM
ncbi:2-methylcitrate dehydratase PrpD [Enhydrobacter aerosaccus]|uniref:2-methylcitrate dehydratase PrpD n=1 Tax=Enhydrobacter aerosaccus TaxID=225324 RepID=A0A1T4L8U6_9HYPH|nr:MmgE/PrpD family protein [Enhydrobacter aerosaccus]SJZ50917.1 2-methylcitrate dehydratase PrpD [Enhydrobacter aerosaccus]